MPGDVALLSRVRRHQPDKEVVVNGIGSTRAGNSSGGVLVREKQTEPPSERPAERRPRPARRRGRRALNTVLTAILAVALAYLVLFPIIRLVLLALQGGGANIARAVGTPAIGQTLLTTIVLAVVSVVMAAVLGTILAWLATRLPPRHRWAAVLPLLPIVLPPIASISAFAFLLAPRSGLVNDLLRNLPLFSGYTNKTGGPINVYSFGWIIAITGLYLTSFMFVFIRAGLARVGPQVVEAARSNGATPGRAFFRIVIPLLRPSLTYGGAICLLLGLSQFTAPLILGGNENIRVLTTDVYYYVGLHEYGLAAALSMPLLLMGTALVLAQRGLLTNSRRFASDVGKGVQGTGRASRWALPGLLLYGLLMVVVPIATLVVVSLSPFWSGHVDFSTFTLRNFSATLDLPAARTSVQTSLLASVAGVLVAIPVGYLAAEVIYRRRGGRVISSVVDFIVGLPLGIPAVVFGLGFLYFYSQPGFELYGTPWIIILLYVTLMLPYAVRLQLTARLSLGDSYEAAARSSGAGVLRTHLRVVVPMMRSSIAGAAALMFVLLSHEFSASVFVRSVRTQVMGTQLYAFWSTGTAPKVAVMGIVMCVVTAVGVSLASWAGSGTLEKL
ncbi:iron ABC transporter permease [Amycolatopsis sp. GM8]|uniref:ABC transporter permease n=1 Tax=Amycolatopsis sp. GM8 TaxID=2896530 RepID=UPI001F1D54D0|nr:iron ABC transporter permease [Amycolatopsis sp. GM8]